MATYTLEIEKQAEKQLRKVGRGETGPLRKKIGQLLVNPKSYGKPLKGDLSGKYKGRCDPYRIIYEIDELRHVVRILRIDTRDDVYQTPL